MPTPLCPHFAAPPCPHPQQCPSAAAALFFTFLFPLIFLFAYAGIFAHGNPAVVVYMFGPLITLNIMGSGFWGLGSQSVMQRERGSLRRYRLAPIGPGSMVLSSLLANYLLGLPTVGLLVACAMVFFHMPLQIDLLTLLALVTAGTFAFAGFGLTIASVANTMQEAQIYNNVIWFTLLFLSGVTVPLPMLPHWIQRFAAFLPATYLVTSFQAIMVGGEPLSRHWLEMLVLVVSGTFGLLLAWKLFRWEKEEKISPRAKLLGAAFVVPFLLMGTRINTHRNLVAWAETYSLLSRSTSTGDQHAAPQEGILLDDFESDQAPERLLEHWQVSTQASAAGLSVGELSIVAPGAAGTAHALRFHGRLGSDGGRVSARYAFPVAGLGKSTRGLEVEVRGDSRVYQLKINPPAAGAAIAAATFVPDSDWQAIRLPASLANPSRTSRSGVNGSLEITVDGAPGEFHIELDELRLY